MILIIINKIFSFNYKLTSKYSNNFIIRPPIYYHASTSLVDGVHARPERRRIYQYYQWLVTSLSQYGHITYKTQNLNLTVNRKKNREKS